jgi:hypothetical protein
MGIGDWGLGIGDWAQSPIPNPQSPIPNPQSPFSFLTFSVIYNLYNIIMKKFKVSVMGGGSFGTALGSLSARLGHLTVMYVTNPTVVEDINKNHANKRYFPEDLKLPNQLKATSDLKECLDGTNMIIHAIPVQKSYDFLMENKNLIPNNIP